MKKEARMDQSFKRGLKVYSPENLKEIGIKPEEVGLSWATDEEIHKNDPVPKFVFIKNDLLAERLIRAARVELGAETRSISAFEHAEKDEILVISTPEYSGGGTVIGDRVLVASVPIFSEMFGTRMHVIVVNGSMFGQHESISEIAARAHKTIQDYKANHPWFFDPSIKVPPTGKLTDDADVYIARFSAWDW
jgi:hypothetical protein